MSTRLTAHPRRHRVLVFADLLQALGELRNLIGCPVLGLVHGANADPLRRKRRGELSGEGGDAMLRGPQLTDEQIRQYKSEGRPSVVRFAMPAREYRFTDVVLGKEIVLGESQVQDFVIRKTDGMPTYHFAVVADDAAMGITHILRGQEHLLNTVNHIALQEALGRGLDGAHSHVPGKARAAEEPHVVR